MQQATCTMLLLNGAVVQRATVGICGVQTVTAARTVRTQHPGKTTHRGKVRIAAMAYKKMTGVV